MTIHWRTSLTPPTDIAFAGGVPQGGIAPVSIPKAAGNRSVLVAYDVGLRNSFAGKNFATAILQIDGVLTPDTIANWCRQGSMSDGDGPINLVMPPRGLVLNGNAHVLSLFMGSLQASTTDIAGYGSWPRIYVLDGTVST